MVKDAEAHAEEDQKKKEEVEVRNQADSLTYSTEQTLNELGDKVDASLKSEAEEALQKTKDVLEGEDVEAIKSATENLQSVGYKLAEIVYADAQASNEQASSQDASQAQSSSDDDVVEAEYEVVDEDKDKKEE